MQLIAEMLKGHDRRAVRVSAYSIGPNTGDSWRRRAEQAVDSFRDIAGVSDADAIALARSDQLDIAVDLTGLTRGHRFALFAGRLAPVQAGYLGYMGSMGSRAIDYLIADAILLPSHEREHYDEAIAFLPDCFQVNCSRAPVAPDAATRGDHGLPDEGFVVCCFNSHTKITPAVFATWMDIVSAVEGSCLWLWAPREEA
jgi:predicted O-linked N-acetylglucosamine transferase (SPINDLY family)